MTDPAHVKPLLGQAPSGWFVITSRRATGWHGIATPVPLDVLDPAESRQLLVGILAHGRGRGPAGVDGADTLCAELGHLPLAIEQAGAYIAETAITPAGYLRLLAAYPAGMYAQTAEGGDAQRTIARIWRVTLDHLATTTPTAGPLLRVLAFYAPVGIPRTLLDGLASSQQLTTAIGRLAAYSMIITSGDTLAVHRLVQAVTRTPDPADPHRTPAAIDAAREQATALLDTAAPRAWQDPADWPAWRTVLPHVEALASHTTAGTDTSTTAALLNRAAAFLENQGAPARAIPLFERTLADRVRVLGEDHPDTLTARNNLAYAYRSAGDLARAIPLFERTLTDCAQVLGEDHPDTLTARNNLAGAYRSAGDLARAIPLFERTLDDRRRVLGEEHPDTLASRNNLAYRLPGRRGPGPRHPAVRAHPHRSAPRCWARTTSTPSPSAIISPTPTGRRGTWPAPSRCSSAPSPIARQVLGDDHPLTKTVRGNLRAAGG